MAENWGPGVTTVLESYRRQMQAVVWQDDKPPMDSELNLVGALAAEASAETLRKSLPSGFLIDPARALDDYATDPLNSNQFLIGGGAADEDSPVLVAAVNGWLIPVTGTAVPEGAEPVTAANRIRLAPPPTTDARTDFVFLEVWRALIAPSPSTVNKPSSSELWAYGNVGFGGTQVPDDLEHPHTGTETTRRIQLQYRIRVVGSGDAGGTSVDLGNYPDGLDDPQVVARGAASAPVGGAVFENMRATLGDAGLWRAGDGNPENGLGTVDGYVYAIPMTAVFRRNAAAFTATAVGIPNQNGAPERTPNSRYAADPTSVARLLTQATLSGVLTGSATGWVDLTGLPGSGLSESFMFPPGTDRRYLTVGSGVDREVLSIVPNPDPGGHPNAVYVEVAGRGRAGTQARRHPAGTPVSLYNPRPDGLYSDQIAPTDLVDLRRSVTPGEWDYTKLLRMAVAALVQNQLRTVSKTQAHAGGTVGPVVTEVSYLQAPSALPLSPPGGVALADGPDGIRTVWSDSAAVQREVTVALDPEAPLSNGFTASTFDSSVAATWATGADFQPRGFLNNLGAGGSWTNGSVVFVHLGGTDGAGGARLGLVGSQRAVRFIAPREAWVPDSPGAATPWRLRFVGGPAGNAPSTGTAEARNGYRAATITTPPGPGESESDHPGPMYPHPDTGFERPFIVLGGVVHPTLYVPGVAATADAPGATFQNVARTILVPGVNWDSFNAALGPRGETLRDYLTNHGQDETGASSLLYLVAYGDRDSRHNNGAFRVVGAGTATATGGPYTNRVSSDSYAVVVEPLSADWNAFADNPASTVTLEFRSQEITAEDDQGSLAPPAGVAVVMTDLQALGTVWGAVDSSVRIQSSGMPSLLVPIRSKAILSMDLLWYPGRGSSPRVADRIDRFSNLAGASGLVRNALGALDAQWSSETGVPAAERFYDPVQVQLWNRLPSCGLDAPAAPGYGGGVVGMTEQSRESELFVDPGSKSVFFRPLTLKPLMLKGFNAISSRVGTLNYPPGGMGDPPKDAASIWTTAKTLGYALPPEHAPRFGRQDIPYHRSTGGGDPIMPGINHLFADTSSASAPVFYVIGGENNPGPEGTARVTSMLFATGPISYGQRGTVGGAPHPATGARKCNYGDVISSDLGVGLRGVELPPYHGIARLYGVYERNDFLANLDPSFIGGFQSDRVTPVVGSVSGAAPVNLLKTDATRQTLFIRQGGASDVTGSDDSHTYIVPESALDLTAIPGYTGVETFATYEYVVECVIFGFAEGFINRNNFVLARRSTGTGVPVADADTPELLNVGMVVHAAAAAGDALCQVYQRTVYQGDPYGTREGSSIQTADYTARYGSVPTASAYQLGTPIQQFESNGSMAVSRSNLRALQVLSSMDFYTTLGTGKVGGEMYPGTALDCGYVDPEGARRVPASPSDPLWPVRVRAFTAGTRPDSPRAGLRIQILNHTWAITSPQLRVRFYRAGVLTADAVGGSEFGVAATSVGEVAESLASWINDPANQLTELEAVLTGDSVELSSRVPGSSGNQWRVVLTSFTPDVAHPPSIIARLAAPGGGPYPAPRPVPPGGAVTAGNLVGGEDLPSNGGPGNSIVSLTGMTERLPLGILVSDCDFLGESLSDGSTAFSSGGSGFGATYTPLPLTREGFEYTRFLGEPGAVVGLCDGGVLRYTPYTGSTPGGSRAFRIYRGGGGAFVLSGSSPGGPLVWSVESFPPATRPVLKGAALAVRALLVRNFHEEAFGVASVRSEGDELQLLVLTSAVYGQPDPTRDGVLLGGVISPTGYGEGYAAADRFRIPGRPMDRARARRAPPLTVTPAPYIPR